MADYCKDCTYGSIAGEHIICNYFLSTGIRRPCPAGDGCTVKKKGRKVNNWGYEDGIKWKQADEYRKQCREERLEQIRRERHLKNIRIATCPECGKEFEAYDPKRIYCSNQCKCRVESRKRYRKIQEARAAEKGNAK